MSLELLVALLTAWLRDGCCLVAPHPDADVFRYQVQCRPKCAVGREFSLDVSMTLHDDDDDGGVAADAEAPWAEYRNH